MTPSELFEQVVETVPAFDAVRTEHLDDNDELLAHLLMADLLRFVGLAFGQANTLGVTFAPPSRKDVSEILDILERGLTAGNPETENAIAVSFVEDIETEPFFPELEPLLGPRVRTELQRQRDWHGSA